MALAELEAPLLAPPCCLPVLAAGDLAAEAAALAAAAGPLVETLPDGRCRLSLVVETLDCAACLPEIEGAVRRAANGAEARVNLTTRRLMLGWRPQDVALEALLQPLLALGHRLAPFDPATRDRALEQERRCLVRSLAVAGFAAGNVMLLSVSIWSGLGDDMGTATRGLLHWVSALIALPAVAYAGRPFFRSALAALKAGRLNMDVPISLAVILSAGMSLFETIRDGEAAYFDASVTLLFFLLIGRLLDQLMRGRARSAAENLLALQVASALVVLPDGRRQRRAAAELAAGDLVLVAAGERLPADGRVASGSSELDVSMVTGESLPVAVRPGSPVNAGTLNLTGELRIRVSKAGGRTLLAEMLRLVEAAEQGRARYVRLADRVARLYAPAVHLLALGAFVLALAQGLAWQVALMNAIAVLIVTCPCALGLAVPAVQVAAVSRLWRRGILVKSADALERLSEVRRVVFDKTGTLTLGRPRLLGAEAIAPADLTLAARLAAGSRHPLAQALVAAAGPVPLLDRPLSEIPGYGLVARLPAGEVRLGSARHVGLAEDGADAAPALWLRRPDGSLCRFAFVDAPRTDAAETITRLRRAGLEVELLSGDRASVAAHTAAALGIARWRAPCLPQEKLRHLQALAAAGERVLMVGDGLNDAPALAAASVSLSPAAGSDLTQSAADLVFQGEALAPVAEAVAVARKARRLVLQNFALAIGYNVVAVPLAMAGLITPLWAALFMSLSSLAVTANALRAARG